MERVDGGYAFPTNNAVDRKGMSLRDYFAGQALMGLCANFRLMEKVTDEHIDFNRFAAETSYELADATIKARG